MDGKTVKSEPAMRPGRAAPTTERPQCKSNRLSMKLIRLVSALALLVIAIGPARAADPVFPPGVRVGMVPLVGLQPAKAFAGFETEDQSVRVLVAELPAEAYGEVMNALKTNPAVAGGAKPESIETAAGTAYYTAETARNGATTVRR